MAERLDDNPLTAQIPGFSHRKIRLGPTFHTVSLLFATFSRWLAPQRLTGVDADPFQVIFASKHRKNGLVVPVVSLPIVDCTDERRKDPLGRSCPLGGVFRFQTEAVDVREVPILFGIVGSISDHKPSSR